MPRPLGIALAAVSFVLALGGAAAAAPFDLDSADWEGCSDFVQIGKDDLGAQRVIVTSKLDMHDLKREDGVILVHPSRPLDVDALSSFMRHGGRVILLDDYGTGEALLEHFQIQRVPLPAHPAEMLRQNPAFALAEPASGHPVVHDVSKVVTNHATGVSHPSLSPVLKVRGAGGEPDVLLAEAGAVGFGRFLAVGDGSVVINSMLHYPGNRALARALYRYATDDDPGSDHEQGWKRGGRVFVLANAFEETGAFGDDSSLVDDVVNEIKRRIEDVRQDGFPTWLAYVLAGAVGLGIVLWVGARAGKTHRALSPRFVRPTPAVSQGGVAGYAAVLRAPTTARALAILELKSALEEGLCAILELPDTPSHEALLRKLSAQGVLDAEGLRTLKHLLVRMANVETMFLARRGHALERIRDREVVTIAKAVQSVLKSARARAKELAAPVVLPSPEVVPEAKESAG